MGDMVLMIGTDVGVGEVFSLTLISLFVFNTVSLFVNGGMGMLFGNVAGP